MILTACIHAPRAHTGQVRNRTDIPYVRHPLKNVRILAEETKYPVLQGLSLLTSSLMVSKIQR